MLLKNNNNNDLDMFRYDSLLHFTKKWKIDSSKTLYKTKQQQKKIMKRNKESWTDHDDTTRDQQSQDIGASTPLKNWLTASCHI